MLATVLDPSGHECMCVLRGAESLLGFESVDDVSIPYALWPLSELELWTAPRLALPALMAEPAAMMSLLALASRAQGLHLTERIMHSRSATARLAQFLLISERVDESDEDETPSRVELPRHVMARVLAMRPETLSRTLKRLEADGAIEVGADIRILDRARLKSASQ